MMKTVSILLAFFSSTFLFAQEHVNHTDTQGKKQGKWIYYGRDMPEKGLHPDSIALQGHYVDDRKEGTWVMTRPDGTKIKGEYQANRPMTNCSSVRTRSGEKMTMEKNQLVDSVVKVYHDTGIREYEAFYNQYGKEEGRVNYYYPNAQLEFTYVAKNGIPVDTAYRYYINGDLKETIVYGEGGEITKTQEFAAKNPLPKPAHAGALPQKIPAVPNTRDQQWKSNGYNKVYNSDNEIWQDGVFKNGVLQDGKDYYYDEDGILLHVHIFKGGVFHSEGQL